MAGQPQGSNLYATRESPRIRGLPVLVTIDSQSGAERAKPLKFNVEWLRQYHQICAPDRSRKGLGARPAKGDKANLDRLTPAGPFWRGEGLRSIHGLGYLNA